MKKILISIAAASALAAAALPAAAQSHGGYDHNDRYDHRGGAQGIARGDQLQVRINRAERNHQINRREANRLREQVRLAERLSWRYRADGVMTRWERADLDRRFDSIRAQLRYERNDRDYGSGYGGGYRR
jgi:Ni/Co efflux regulator RcnB